MTSLTGQLLIAAPEMTDDFFTGTVVLIFQHSFEGAGGIILNKPSDVPVRVFCEEIGEELAYDHPHASQVIHIGGPCEGPLIAAHNSLAMADFPVIPGLALTSEPDYIRQLVRQTQQSVKLFSGYSGWAPDQLEAEIERGGWYIIPARPPMVLQTSVDLWRNACAQYGDEIIKPLAGVQLPSDPSLN